VGARKTRSPVSIRINFSNQKTNLEAGTWYLHRAMEHWTISPSPIPLLWRSIMPAPVVPIAERWKMAFAEIPEHRFLQKIDFRGNAQIRRIDYWTATNSIRRRGGCDEK